MHSFRSRFSPAVAPLSAALLSIAMPARADVTVTTAADLATALATSPNTVVLGSDIDMTDWTTVADFSGTIDGKGYALSNLRTPLFGDVTGDVAISNLVV